MDNHEPVELACTGFISRPEITFWKALGLLVFIQNPVLEFCKKKS